MAAQGQHTCLHEAACWPSGERHPVICSNAYAYADASAIPGVLIQMLMQPIITVSMCQDPAGIPIELARQQLIEDAVQTASDAIGGATAPRKASFARIRA